MGNLWKPTVIPYPYPCRYSVHRYGYGCEKIYLRVTPGTPYWALLRFMSFASVGTRLEPKKQLVVKIKLT